MFYCLECGNRFEEPQQDTWSNVKVCPHCKVDGYIKLVPCKQCSELKIDSECGYCNACRLFVTVEIAQAIEELKNTYDPELVEDALAKWMEGKK